MRELFYRLSPELRFVIRKVYFFPEDLYHQISGKRKALEPKKGDIYIGSGDFIKQGQSQVALLKELIDLQENDTVLDIGSGIGRTAVPLTEFIINGKYEGFDVVKKGVDWCNKHIKSKYPNFNFTFTPLHNDLYNTYSTEAVSFKFPYADHSFDKAFLFSVFTHMRIDEIQHYLKEIRRVLKKDGKCLATFFLYDDKEEEKIKQLEGFNFPHKFEEGYRLMSRNVQNANIALHNELLLKLIENADLEIESIEEGFWKGNLTKEQAKNFQDVVIIKSK